jgi:hypothetical protein
MRSVAQIRVPAVSLVSLVHRLRRPVFALVALLVVGLSVGERVVLLPATLAPGHAWAYGSGGDPGDAGESGQNGDSPGAGGESAPGGGDDGGDSGGDGGGDGGDSGDGSSD